MPPCNVPEPDIAITAEPEGGGFIPLASLALVIEVADTTLRNDLNRKRKIYAREGVTKYWVVDVRKSVFHQMWSPKGETYAEQREINFGEQITAVSIDGLSIETDRL